MIDMIDVNGNQVAEGDTVEIRVKTWNGHIVVCKGPVEFKKTDLSSYGCGYGINDPKGFTFLSSITKSNTEIEMLKG